LDIDPWAFFGHRPLVLGHSCKVLLALALLTYLLFFHRLADRDLWSSHEARAAQNAQTMLESGHWGLPRMLDGKPELQKPPLYYWLVAGIGSLRGQVDAWAVRLPSAASALLCALAVFGLLWRRGRPRAGLLAGLSLGTMVHFTWMARVGRIDMPLSMTVAAILGCYYLAWQSRRRESRLSAHCWLLGAYLSAAASILLKGPVGIVLAAAVVTVHQFLESEFTQGQGSLWRRVPVNAIRLGRELGLWWGLPLLAILVLPWFVWANLETQGEFFRVFFLRHNLQRGLGGDEQFETHFHPWWFYAYRLAVDLQPWSLGLPLAGWLLCRQRWWREDQEARLGVVWLLTITLVLSLFDYKRADYLLPAYAGAALLIGCVAERMLRQLVGWRYRVLCSSLVAIFGCSVVGWLAYVDFLLPRWEPEREHRRFAASVRQCVPQPGLVLLFRVEAHPLVYHLGRPLDRIWEWENLDIWACQPVPVFVVMPESEAKQWPQHLEAGQLHPVLTNSQLAGTRHDDPLVLLCTRPVPP
jgi:4-amino-4-deoxy-L-arabinose transferase-like glycosyltransferase